MRLNLVLPLTENMDGLKDKLNSSILESLENIIKALPELATHAHIMCWCPDEPKGQCHGDVLIELMEELS